jgi:hypothetical protein
LIQSLDLAKGNLVVRKSIVVLLLACATFSAFAEKLADNPRLAEIFKEDQDARKTMPIDWSKVAPMDKMHQEEVLALLRSGGVRTANDLYHAAMVMQHGGTTESYRLAFSLSELSATLDPANRQARWLSAASWDRILMSKGVPQWYGTQYRSSRPGGPMELYKVDESVVSDSERAEMNVPALQEAKDMLLRINK